MYSSSFPEYSMSTSPHRVSRLTFIFYSLDLLHKVTYIFWALTCVVALPLYTALISNFYTSSQDFDTHFLHFHLTMDSLCFSMWLAIYTSTTDFHRLVKRHACRTTTKNRRIKFLLFFCPYCPDVCRILCRALQNSLQNLFFYPYWFRVRSFIFYKILCSQIC